MDRTIILWILVGVVLLSGIFMTELWLTSSQESEIPEETVPATEPIIEPSEWFEVDTEPTEPQTEPTEPTVYIPTIEDLGDIEAEYGEAAIYMAKTIWGEARGDTREGQEKVAWCILNRVDDPRFPDTIIGVITQPHQFHGYSPNFPCEEEFYELALDVITRWQLEKIGGESNRNLEPEYVFFCADSTGLGNVFRTHW